ncbi:MAG: hypothetical protein M1570_03900 [Chloroflexi bacterium]|nr:hypothetical protein [Chloroflexota bacterium]
MRKLVLLIGLVLTLAIAYGADQALGLSRERAAQTFDRNLTVWPAIPVNLVVAVAVLLLCQTAVLSRWRSKLVLLCFILVGLGLLISGTPPIMGSLGALHQIRVSPVAPDSLLFHVAAFVTVTGFWGLMGLLRHSPR